MMHHHVAWMQRQWDAPGKLSYWAAGALAALALPPFFWWPMLFFSFIWLWRGVVGAASASQLFWRGWWWGMGYFMAGLYWFSHALLTDPWRFGWLIPPAVTLIPAALAVYIGLAALLARPALRAGAGCGVIAFASAWAMMEWLRSHLFTGFPWNSLGYVMNASLPTMQLAAVGGVWIMGFFTVLIALMPWVARHKLAGAGGAVVVLLLLVLAGEARLARIPAEDTGQPWIRLVQGHIDQQEKWTPQGRVEGVFSHMRLSTEPAHHVPALVIWPETAVPYSWSEDFFLRPVLAKAVPPDGVLLTGMVRDTGDAIYNSLIALGGDDAALQAVYDKRHLVPFGEYVPLRSILPLVAMVYGGRDFSTGVGDSLIRLSGLPAIRPLICYEAIFPEMVRSDTDSRRPQLLLNITNDAWFGHSTGPYQHFEAARLRAVEQGVPMARAANTGISAVVDAAGRVRSMLKLGETGQITAMIPRIVPDTIYAQSQYLVILLVGILWLICSTIGMLTR